jgi:type II secretory pathway pseudopilin PulG
MLDRRQRRHRAQAGTTLIELLVATMIIGLALLLLVGAFSTGLIDATLAKRNTGVQAAISYELEKIAASTYSASPAQYSECFAVDSPAAPTQVPFRGSCPGGTDLRADVTEADAQPGIQQWSVQVSTYPGQGQVGPSVSVYKVNR